MKRIDEHSSGVFIIAATPFQDNGELDLESARQLCDFYLSKGVSGITILGMMGEAPKLGDDETREFMALMLKQVNQQVPVLVGVSTAGLNNLHALSQDAMEQGAAGVMVAPPGHLQTGEAIHGYYRQVADILGPEIPLCYQDYPLSTGVQVSVAIFLRLVADIPSLVMLKHEDWPGLNKISAIREAGEQDRSRRISILCGNGGLFLPQELTRGADGAMTGFAYPEMLVQVCRLHAAGSIDEAEDLFDCFLPLVRYEQQPGFGLAVRKEILRRRGVIRSAATRQPGPRLKATDQQELDHMLRRLERRLSTRYGENEVN